MQTHTYKAKMHYKLIQTIYIFIFKNIINILLHNKH